MQKILDLLHDYGDMTDKALERFIPESGHPPVIYQAMRYSLLGGGKRLRSFLTLKGCEVVGGDVARALPAACAVEMVHAYSLVHDDLPCMDNDDYRRGKPSNHKVFGEGLAVLAGDGLLTMAFEVLARYPDNMDADTRLELIRELAHAAGCNGMIGGQAFDLESEGHELDHDMLAFLHASKTGALIRAAIRMGALAGGADAAGLRALGDYAEALGLAFQITDDILDVAGEAKQLGKPIGSDSKKGKATYVSRFGLEQARRMARREVEAACVSLKPFGEAARALEQLALWLPERTK